MELFRLLGTIAIDNTNANRSIQDTTEEARDSESTMSKSFKAIGGAASKLATGIGIAGASIGGTFLLAVEGTREYRKEMGLLESSFTTAGHSSETAKKTYSELNSVLGDTGQSVEAAQQIALLTDNEKELQTWTDICTGVFATYGAALPVEGLAEASNETAKVGIITGSLADALNWAGISEEEFQAKLDACTTEQQRQDLIMNTLNDTYKEASNQYKETNKDVMDSEKANEKLADAFAELGAIGEPILTKIKENVAEMVSVAVPKIQEFIEKIKDCIKWIKENEDTINTWVAVIIGATTSIGLFLLILNWGKIMAASTKAIQGVTAAVKLFNIALKSNPIGLVISIIAGLVAAIIYLWNTNEDFRKFWIDAWNKIKEECLKAWESIKKAWSKASEWFNEIWQKIKKNADELWKSVKKFFSDAYSSIKNVWNSCVSFFKNIWQGIVNVYSGTSSWFSNIFQNAWSGITRIWDGAKSFFSNIWGGIKSAFGNVTGWFSDIFGKAFGFVKDIILRTFSAGGQVFSGIKSGLERIFKSLINTVIGGINTIITVPFNTINSVLKKLKSIEVLKIKPFTWVKTFTVPKIPKLAEGGVLEKGQLGLLEGTGAEAVVPLEQNTKWIEKVANQLESKINNNVPYQILIERMNTIISILEKEKNIYLNSGVLVGELAPGIDERLGSKYKHIQRGNTR